MKHGEYNHFFNIVPRDEVYLEEMNDSIPLKVVRGIDTTPDLNINVTNLSHGYKHFHDSGGAGIKFKIKVIIDRDDKVGDTPLTEVLDNYARSMTPVGIRCNAIDIPDGVYLITDNPSRSQESDRKTVWELTFQTYNPVTVFKYKNDNTGVKNALKKAKNHNKKVKNAKLKKCDYKKLVYSKKKKVVKCVKYMQQVLYKNKLLTKKQVDGWFGKETKAAVKKFQKNYNKKNKVKIKSVKGTGNKNIVAVTGKLITNTNNPNISLPTGFKLSKPKTSGSTKGVVKNKVLPETGKVDKATYKALCNS